MGQGVFCVALAAVDGEAPKGSEDLWNVASFRHHFSEQVDLERYLEGHFVLRDSR